MAPQWRLRHALDDFSSTRDSCLSRYDFTSQRLFVEAKLEDGAIIAPAADQLNYLLNVLRLRDGDKILIFNGVDGEWRARLENVSRKKATLVAFEQTRGQEPFADLDHAFAPLKQARLDYMIQKSTEMGVTRLHPVITRRTQVRRVNRERLRANAIEAAEQCGVLIAPIVEEEIELPKFLSGFPPERLLVFCDENADLRNPIDALQCARAQNGLTLLIGPEGGFDDFERDAILRLPNLVRLSLGPRILRADTAAVAALALIQSTLGDWTKS
jgi:16S rRNA (uracil1498-N3)-methyltransferase